MLEKPPKINSCIFWWVWGPQSWRLWWPFEGGWRQWDDDQFEEKGPGLRKYFAVFRCKQQSKPISYTHTVAALLRFAQSFANDFNIILTIGTTRRSRGVEWGIVTWRNKDILLGNILVIPVRFAHLQSSNIQGNYSSLHSLRSFQSS